MSSPSPNLNVIDDEDYDAKLFVNEREVDQDWICSICLSVARQPLNLDCPHLFCSACSAKTVDKDSDTFSCPVCRETTADYSRCKVNRKIQQQIEQLLVKCKRQARGCEASFTIGSDERNLRRHGLEECEFRLVRCEKASSGCDVGALEARQLSQHRESCKGLWRNCSHCQRRLALVKLTKHEAKCEEAPVTCESCLPEVTIRRRELPAHNSKFAHKHEMDALRRSMNELHEAFQKQQQQLQPQLQQIEDIDEFLQQSVSKQLLRNQLMEGYELRLNELQAKITTFPLPIGTVLTYAGAAVPDGFLWCDGSDYPLSTYPALSQVLGHAYQSRVINQPRGIGWRVPAPQTFRVPDLRGRVGMGAGTGAGLTARNLGDMGGEEAVTLSEQHLPPHQHQYRSSSGAGGVGNSNSAHAHRGGWGGGGGGTSIAFTNQNGNGRVVPCPNLQPFTVVNYIIKY